MPRSHPLPKIWLMTDARFGDDQLRAIQHLPARSGVVFRHYDLATQQRRILFAQVLRICRRRGHILLLAGDARTALRWHADGFHQRSRGHTGLLHSAPVHNAREIADVKRSRPDLLFLSPLFDTNSHPGARPLGPLMFLRLAKLAGPKRIIALGGMTRQSANMLGPRMIHGWAAIDAFRKKPA
ncbi:MAG: thiamine phosphate synthase [Sphingorhabdus sp.]|jgi:thiamine-phosphate pyrophosphorylase|uniref:thiamine phosphate synthase n=1 Tax=Sphingorhabdus sp. TaxID=1902408 RepID=UPI0026007388|nr:thiamine phosphate synthase [Sphingorhabdus sp.]MCO4090798.1 thiamine phosphate synthase [Sphingorhabdus sp.]